MMPVPVNENDDPLRKEWQVKEDRRKKQEIHELEYKQGIIDIKAKYYDELIAPLLTVRVEC